MIRVGSRVDWTKETTRGWTASFGLLGMDMSGTQQNSSSHVAWTRADSGTYGLACGNNAVPPAAHNWCEVDK